VTGGGTGIGRAIATELASLGATAVVASRDGAKCRTAAEEMNARLPDGCGGRVVAGPSTSIRSDDEIRALISHIIETYGSLDMVVNNAGGQFVCFAEDLSTRGFMAVVETNLQGTYAVCREAYLQHMRDNGGSIVNITLPNRNGIPGMVHSCAARAGVENMTKTLCSEWMESGVRINCVRPGIVWTESGFENYGPAGDVFISKVLPAQPSKRFGTPEEVSSAVTWLLCEGAAYVTGTTLQVDGGGAFHFIPLMEFEDTAHLPIYGTLPRKARL